MSLQVSMVLIVGLALGADKPAKDEAAKGLQEFQGTWTLVAMEADGQKIDEDALKNANLTLVVKGEKFTLNVTGGEIAGTLTLDPAKKPKTYDAKGTDPTGRSHEVAGIYKIEGDTLTICAVYVGKDRPTEFKAGAGSGAGLQVFKRAKK